MKAITILPGAPNTVALEELAEPSERDGALLVRALELGVCGTDFDLLSGEYGTAPPDSTRLILGHESLGRVEAAPEGSGFRPGDLVVGLVRRPDPQPCSACGAGEWDMCLNGRYTERGIKERHGYGSERWRIETDFALKVEPGLRDAAVLIEPTSVVAKAWDHITSIGHRAHWSPKTLLVTGAGPIGLLAAMMGVQRGLEVHVLDRVEDGPKPKLVEDLGATYHTGSLKDLPVKPDIVIECSGAASVMRDAVEQIGNNGILCMVGSSKHVQSTPIDVGHMNRALVLGNGVIFGVVNAARKHHEQAADALRKASRSWLTRLITRRESIDHWRAAFERQPGDVKVIIEFPA